MGQGRRKSTPRWHKAVALLPLVALSGAWSANAASDPETEPVAETGPLGTPAVPEEIFSQPASVALPEGFSAPTELTPIGGPAAARSGSAGSYATAANGIPTSALYAYRRAADILNEADPSCNIDWTLIAAIGRVESDHGRFGGNVLDSEGKAQPGIFGIPLDGSNGTARILDTDDGVLDGDPVYDRAVGPMQFIPSTWAVAGVDADQDGVKDPQDIDDAATASGVYLCAGDSDLSTDSGLRSAVYRYNHSSAYVDLVLSIMSSYAGGNYAPVPNGTASATTLTPLSPAQQASRAEAQQRTQRPAEQRQEQRSERADDGNSGAPSSRPTGEPPGSDDEAPREEGPRNDDRDDRPDSPTPSSEPTQAPSTPGADEVVEDVEETVKKTVETLNLAEATALCDDKLGGTLLGGGLVDACGAALKGETLEHARHLLRGSVADVIARLGL